MMTRIVLAFSLFFLASCSNVKDEETTEGKAEPKASEGIVILQQTETDTLKGSPKAYASATIGNTKFTINYHSPATRDRTIWGGLVAYNNVWVTGAHKATNIEFDHNIKIGETTVKEGKYALFTIPGKDQWTIIINKNWNQHLADDYSEAEDVVRIKVAPETQEIHQERLRYVIEPETENAGEIVIYWEKLEVSVPFEILNLR